MATGVVGAAAMVGLRHPEAAEAADLLDGRTVDLSGMTARQVVALSSSGSLGPATVSPPLPTIVVSAVAPGAAVSAALQAEIQAIDATTGGVLLLGPGTYGLDQTLAMRANVTIRGVGLDRTVLRAAGTLGDPAVAAWSGTGWALEDLTVDGNRSGGSGTGTVVMLSDQDRATLRRVRVTNGAQGIYADGDGHLLEDVRVDGMTDPGVVLNGAGCRVVGLIASANRSYVVRIRDDSEVVDARIVTDPASLVVQIQLRGNRISCLRNRIDSSATVPPAVGSQNATAIGTGAGCTDLLIADNVVVGRASGIYAGAFDLPGTLRNVQIVGNRIDGGAFDGILVGDGSAASAAENVVIGQNVVRDIRIHGDPTYDYGVGIETHCDNVLITGNAVDGTDGGGIFAVTGKNVTIVGNSVRNAGFQNKSGGIEFNTRDTLIAANQVIDAGDPAKPKGNSRAIGSYGRSDAGAVALDGTHIQGNHIVDDRPTAGVKYGIAVFAGTAGGTAALSGNVVRGLEVPFSAGAGWKIEGFPTNTTVLARQDGGGSPVLASATYADLPGMAISFVEPVGPYWLAFALPGVETAGAGRLSVQVTDAGGSARLTREITAPGTAGWRGSLDGRLLVAGTGGAVTLRLRAKATGGSSWRVVGENGPQQLTAVCG